jgi:hypothetical protein
MMIATIQWENRHGQDQKAFPKKNWGFKRQEIMEFSQQK